jgi:hypothetical protein
MTEPRKLCIFLCHSSQDKPIVRELYQRLKAENWIDPWLDEEKLLPGQDWDLEIEKTVETADAVIVCLSNNSVTKEGYVQRELRFVLDIALEKPEGTIFIIPLRLDNCESPRRLRLWQYVDYFPESQKDKAFGRLVESLSLRKQKLESPTIDYKKLYRNELASRRKKAIEIIRQKGVVEWISEVAEPLNISNGKARRLLESLVNKGSISGKYRPDGIRIYFIDNEKESVLNLQTNFPMHLSKILDKRFDFDELWTLCAEVGQIMQVNGETIDFNLGIFGTGRPKLLLLVEVIKFLDQHKLLNYLTDFLRVKYPELMNDVDLKAY